MIRLSSLSCVILLLNSPSLFAIAPGAGTVKIDSTGDAKAGVAEMFRLPAHTFEYKLELRHDLRHSGIKVYDLTFPSPVKSDVPENNTVYAELYMPAGDGPFPAAIVLDILQGNALISRGQAMWLAEHGVAGLVVYMAHYGPRRAAGQHRTPSFNRYSQVGCRNPAIGPGRTVPPRHGWRVARNSTARSSD